jgi:acyl phosphate:glycerol-3-phosphate acyltransferase
MSELGILGVLILGYFLGSIPVGILAARWIAGIDPRKVGSRNIGFTNVQRVAGNAAGAVTLLGDMGKGVAAVLAARLFLGAAAEDWIVAVGGGAILGHVYSMFLRFTGGKGVATAFGVFLGIDPILGGSVILIWLISLALWRTSSLAAIIAFASLPVLTWIRHAEPVMVSFAMGVSALIYYRHTENIRRLVRGAEPKFGMGHKAE